MSDPAPLIEAAFATRLGTAVYSYRTGAGTALYSGSVPVFNTLAVQQTPAPYIVFQQLDGVDSYTFGNDSEQSFDYSARVLSQRSYTSQEAEPVYDTVHAHLQDMPMTLAGWKVLKVRRQSRIRFRDGAGFWNVGGLYRIWLATE